MFTQGIISPLLGHLVIDELIRELNKKGVNVVGYAEDFEIFVRCMYEEILPNLTRRVLRRVQIWCEAKSLAVNPGKTEIVTLQGNTKVGLKRQVTFNWQSIPFAEGITYLGVYLDKKLN